MSNLELSLKRLQKYYILKKERRKYWLLSIFRLITVRVSWIEGVKQPDSLPFDEGDF